MSEQLELFPQEELQSENSVDLQESKTIEDAEWCFQFFNNEPIVFAWQSNPTEELPLVLKILPKEGEGLFFRQNGMEFKIFPRVISEESKKQRDLENASKNQETPSESSNS